jgi:hypothetical protein
MGKPQSAARAARNTVDSLQNGWYGTESFSTSTGLYHFYFDDADLALGTCRA